MITFLNKTIFILFSIFYISSSINFKDDFQGKATYVSKTKMELGSWGARMSEAQKKQIAARLKNRLEKEFTLVFNKEESLFVEEEQLDAISGATDSWGKNFAAGENYKNVKSNTQIQQQEFYGKKFLVKDNLQDIQWTLLNESKKLGTILVTKQKHFYQLMIYSGIHFRGVECEVVLIVISLKMIHKPILLKLKRGTLQKCQCAMAHQNIGVFQDLF